MCIVMDYITNYNFRRVICTATDSIWKIINMHIKLLAPVSVTHTERERERER